MNGPLRKAAQALVDTLHGQATGAWNSPAPRDEDFVWYVNGQAVEHLRVALVAQPAPPLDVVGDVLEDMVRQFAYWSDSAGGLTTGGLSTLEGAFEVLGWDDPHPLPDRRCDEPGCMKDGTMGWATRPGGTGPNGGYRRTCWDHSAIGKERAALRSCDYCAEGLPLDATGWHIRDITDPDDLEGIQRIPCALYLIERGEAREALEAALAAQPAPPPLDVERLAPLSARWKKAAKRWRKTARRERERYWRQNEVLRGLGVSIQLAVAVFDKDRGDRVVIQMRSTEPTAATLAAALSEPKP